MGDDQLDVTGGVGGVTARLDDLRTCADRSDEIGDEVRGVAARFAAMAVDGDLVASAVLSPGSAARAEQAVVDVGARATAAAVRLEASARGLRTVAAGWEAMDRAAAVRTDVQEVLTFQVVSRVGLAGTLAVAPFVYTHDLVREVGAWGPFRDGPGGLLDAAEAAGQDTLGDIGGFWSETLLAMPGLTDAVVEWMGASASATTGTALSYEDTVVGLLALAGLAGWFDDDAPVHAERADMTGVPDEDLFLPRGVSDLFDTQTRLMGLTRDDPGSSRLRVIDVGTDGRPAWVVQVPGTQEWGTAAGADPSDLTTNLHLTGPEDAALLDAIDDAMRIAGIGTDDPVMLVGHSQGGIAAAAFAVQSDARGRNVTHVVTGGSPIAHLEVPDDVEVLSMEHTTDPVPRLDGDPNPDRPNWTTVVRDVGGPDVHDDPFEPHSSILYRATGTEVDASGDPSVHAFLTSAQDFFDGDRDPRGAVTDITITRGGGPDE